MPTQNGNNLPQDKDSGNLSRRKMFFTFFCWLTASLYLVCIQQLLNFIHFDRISRYNEGDYIETDFIPSRDFNFVDEDATEKLVKLNLRLANPVFVVQNEITDTVLINCDKFIETLKAIRMDEISSSERGEFYNKYPETRDMNKDAKDMEMLLNLLRNTLEDVQRRGIFPTNAVNSASNMVELVNFETNPGKRILIPREEITHLDNLADRLTNIDGISDLDAGSREFITAFIQYFAEANAYFSKQLSQENERVAIEDTKPVIISVKAGETILKADTLVTGQQVALIQAMRKQRYLSFNDWLKPFLFMAMIFIIGIYSAKGFDLQLNSWKNIWIYTSITGVYLILSTIIPSVISNAAYLNPGLLLPTALMVILINQLLRSRRLSGLTAALFSLLVYFLTKGEMDSFLFTLFSGIGGIMSYRRHESGLELLRTGLKLAIIMALVSLFTGIILDMSLHSIGMMTLIAAGNGLITGILSLAVLPLLGLALNIATAFRLAELSDSNVPILKKIRIQAPGTFIHSQNVAQLAEATCDAIGADGLLARVGSYYHDIGKIDQPHYFIENQSDGNKHDKMPAGLSAAAIRAHVKIGIEKGRELHLPKEVLDIIEQHHGTGLMHFFYNQAIKKLGMESIPEGGFTYDGPIPQSKEAAVVMLADACEAASRTITNPTPAKLEKSIRGIIQDRFNTGELDESNLTPKDMQIIKSTFLSILRGHYHLRIAYPDKNGDME